MVKSSTKSTSKKQIKSLATPLSTKKASIMSLSTKSTPNSTLNELSTVTKATSTPKNKSSKKINSTYIKNTKKNKNGSYRSNNDKHKLKEPNEMEIDNNDLSDGSIDFGMTGGDMDEELFNLKIDASTSDDDDDENSKEIKVDGSDIDSIIDKYDEHVKIDENDNMDIDQKSGRDNLNEELLIDEEGMENTFKRQKNQDPDYNVIKLAFQRKHAVTKKLDPVYHLGLKELWNQVRIKNISKEKRNKYMDELFELIKGKIPEILFKIDTSRIIQSVLKYGTAKQRNIIIDELEGRWLEASKNVYAKFVICKVLKYCPKHRYKIISEFKGNISKLMQHTEARSVILEAYELLNAKQRSSLIQEFYGKEFSLFKETQGLSIEELVKENPSNKDRVLENLSREIEAIMKKPGLIGYIIPQRILLDYFTYANENKIREKIALIGEHVHEFLHTREGSRVAMMCFSYGTVKDRKTMLKTMKDYVEKICCEEYGHLVLLRAFDVVDDTVAVSKYIIEQMTKLNKLRNILQNKWGHRVILYLLAHRSTLYFSYDTLRLLALGDDIRTMTSKKDPVVRANELRQAISPALITYAQNNTSSMFLFTFSTQVLCEILLHADGNFDQKTAILENIARLANKNPNDTENDNIMLSYINRTLKVLVHGGHRKPPKSLKIKEGSKIDVSQVINDDKEELHFGPILFNNIKEYILFYACHLSASFVVLALLENNETNKYVKEELLKGVEQIKNAAQQDEKSGANLILKKLGIKLIKSKKIKKGGQKIKGKSEGIIAKGHGIKAGEIAWRSSFARTTGSFLL